MSFFFKIKIYFYISTNKKLFFKKIYITISKTIFKYDTWVFISTYRDNKINSRKKNLAFIMLF
jgi:hypothetical protein